MREESGRSKSVHTWLGLARTKDQKVAEKRTRERECEITSAELAINFQKVT